MSVQIFLAISSLMCSSLFVSAQLPPASFHHIKRDERLLSSAYHCLAEDEFGFIWFGSRDGGGLYRFDGYDLRTFVVDPSQLHKSLTSNMINTVFSFKDGLLYIGTHGGMTILDLITGEMKCIADEITRVPEYSAFYIEPMLSDITRKCAWIGSAYGLARLHWKSTELEFLRPIPDPEDMPVPHTIIDMLADYQNDSLLWLGSANGLFTFHKDKKTYAFYPSPFTERFVILDIFQDKDGVIWMAGGVAPTKDKNVIVRYNPMSQEWKQFILDVQKSEVVQSTEEAYQILPSHDDGKFWVSTGRSVGLFDKQTGGYDSWTYDPQHPDGLLPNGFFRTMLTDRHGRLWITAWSGIQYSKTAFVKPDISGYKPSVFITGVQVSNARADAAAPLIYTETLNLFKDQRDISFRYVIPNPLDVRSVTYEYQLKGRDQDWTSTDQRQVRYTGLHGGQYTFLVRGKEGNGEWSEITSLPVTIQKRLTEFAWFWIAVVLLSGSLLFGGNRYLILRTRKEEQLKAEFDKKVSEIEMQALRAQMNPHFLFNSLNSIKYYALSKDKDATADFLTKFSLLVRTILNNSKSHTISLKDELDALKLYIEIEHLRLEGKFEYHIDIDSSIRIEQAQIPPMILQPFVENAIWHGLMHKTTGGKLLVQVRDLGTQIQCIIEDNGIGRVKAGEMRQNNSNHKKSMGLQITGDRIALINRIYGIDTQVHVIDLINGKGEAEGTRVIVNIPLINEDEA